MSKVNLSEYAYKEILDTLAKLNDMGDPVEVLNSMARAAGAGSEYARYQDIFFGLNRLPQIPAVRIHTENQGLVFFTKPDLNLSYDNISTVRKLFFLLDQEANSMGHALRQALDPRSQRMFKIRSNITDMHNPYLTFMTNLCLTMSQPPDVGIQVYTSPEGVMKEQWMTADGIAEQHGYYDITCTFMNPQGNPVNLAVLAWLLYIQHLRIGPCYPHPENRVSGRMDYFTRIERFTLDPTGRRIEQWWHTAASVPQNINLGAFMAYNKFENINADNKETSVQFACVGSVFNDPIQLVEFNRRMMGKFGNPGLRDSVRESKYVKIHPSDYGLTNYYGYPLINLATREMEWWIPKEELSKLLKGQRTEEEQAEYSRLMSERTRGRYLPLQ